MKGRTPFRLALLLILTALLAVTVSPLLAQTTPALTQTAQAQDNGLTLSISYPATWVEKTDGNRLLLATSPAALDALSSTGIVSSPGDVGVVIYMPSALASLNLDASAAPDKVVAGYLQMGKVEGDVATRTDFQVPAATSLIAVPTQTDEKGLVGAMQFPDGTIIFGAVPGDAQPDTVLAILKSVSLTGGAAVVIPQPEATAQTTSQNPLSQSAQVTSAGLTLNVAYPATWAEKAASDTLFLATSAEALDALYRTGVVDTPGDIGISISMPSFLTNLQLPADAAPDLVVSTYLKVGKVQGDVLASTDYQVPAATSLIDVPAKKNLKGLLGALQFPAGTVIFAAVPGDAQPDTVLAILKSISLTSGAAVVIPQPEATAAVELPLSETPTTFDVPQRVGSPLQFAINLPEGWVNQYAQDAGLLYIGSSQAVVDKITSPDAGVPAGQVGMTIVMPAELPRVGITVTDTPEHVIASFEKAFGATGTIHSDSSFVVPVAYAGVTGDKVPDGGGAVFALAFDAGMILIVVQPADAVDNTIVNVIRSIRFGAAAESAPTAVPAEPTAVPVAKELRQWAISADGTSQYGTDNWSFAQATGKPDTAECGDNGTAWASESSTGRAVLKLDFATPVIPSQINVYQTYNPGAIVEIDVGSSANPDKVLPLPNSADNSGTTGCPGVFSLNVSGVDTPIDFVVLYIDQSLTGDWNEIDAVELVGTPAS